MKLFGGNRLVLEKTGNDCVLRVKHPYAAAYAAGFADAIVVLFALAAAAAPWMGIPLMAYSVACPIFALLLAGMWCVFVDGAARKGTAHRELQRKAARTTVGEASSFRVLGGGGLVADGWTGNVIEAKIAVTEEDTWTHSYGVQLVFPERAYELDTFLEPRAARRFASEAAAFLGVPERESTIEHKPFSVLSLGDTRGSGRWAELYRRNGGAPGCVLSCWWLALFGAVLLTREHPFAYSLVMLAFLLSPVVLWRVIAPRLRGKAEVVAQDLLRRAQEAPRPLRLEPPNTMCFAVPADAEALEAAGHAPADGEAGGATRDRSS